MARYLNNTVQLDSQVQQHFHPDTFCQLHHEVTQTPITLYGQVPVSSALNLWLYYVSFGTSYEKLQQLFGVPHADLPQIFGAVRSLLLPWVIRQIRTPQTHSDRVTISANEIEDVELIDCTVVLDSVPFRFATSDSEYNSYKLKQKTAIVYQMACTMDSVVRFVDGGQPGSHHDSWCMARCAQSFKWHTVSPGDVVVTNGGYRDLSSYNINCAQPIRRGGRFVIELSHLLPVLPSHWVTSTRPQDY
jgi:hypothetical protein